MNGSISANATMASNFARISGAFHPEDRAVQQHVLAPGQLRVKPGSHLEQRADAPTQLHLPHGGLGHAREDLEQRALAGSVRPDQAERGSARHVERHVAERPEERRRQPHSAAAEAGGGERTDPVRQRLAERPVSLAAKAAAISLSNTDQANGWRCQVPLRRYRRTLVPSAGSRSCHPLRAQARRTPTPRGSGPAVRCRAAPT